MFRPIVEVARDTVGDSEVSTVFLIYGDHSVSPPLVYKVRLDATEIGSYATEVEARAAHDALAASLRSAYAAS